MTTQRSFKRLVRTRMDKTGESYTTARTALLRAEPAAGGEPPPLATSEETIRRRTGLGWEQWFDKLDEWGAAERSHREIARWVAQQLDIEPLVWEAQAVSVSYERARGLRAVGQRADGFVVTAQKTVGVPVERLYDAVVEADIRRRWLVSQVDLRVRTATRPKVAHFDVADRRSRVHVTFTARPNGRSTVFVEHARLADAEQAAQLKSSWRAALTTLKADLETGARDA